MQYLECQCYLLIPPAEELELLAREQIEPPELVEQIAACSEQCKNQQQNASTQKIKLRNARAATTDQRAAQNNKRRSAFEDKSACMYTASVDQCQGFMDAASCNSCLGTALSFWHIRGYLDASSQ
eukprot:17014-Heterococcus_DN1.PRE.2